MTGVKGAENEANRIYKYPLSCKPHFHHMYMDVFLMFTSTFFTKTSNLDNNEIFVKPLTPVGNGVFILFSNCVVLAIN